MNNMEVLQVGNPFLNEIVPEIKSSSEFYDHEQLIKDLVEVCIKWKGMAIASNQIGASVRLFVMMDLSTREFKEYFNPVILSGTGRNRDLEGCLSFRKPEVQYYVRRKHKIDLTYRDIDNTVHIKTFEGLEARCIQHEIDHLNGITMESKGKLK